MVSGPGYLDVWGHIEIKRMAHDMMYTHDSG